MSDKYAMRNFRRSLDDIEKFLKEFEYRGIFEAPSRSYSDKFWDEELPPGTLRLFENDKYNGYSSRY